MKLVHPQRSEDPTPESMFASKYTWLLRWALHFAHNDRAAAEDLVQDTFVRMLLSWDKLKQLYDLEPLLYSYLRYAYLDERRRGRSCTFQSLSTIDSDTLAMSLRTSTSFDQIGIQNELRSILAFLLWRRRSAKFASIFLLRFFHGFFPEEIASICLATRHSIDLSLRHARAELKTYLLDPHQVHVPGRTRMPEFQHPNVAVPVLEFVDDLRREIFNSPRETCPSTLELERHYRAISLHSLESDLLAHIVSCESCLDKVTQFSSVPPPSARSLEDSLGSIRRGKDSKREISEKSSLARIMMQGKKRMQEILEHYPSGLIIALNDEIAAVRDVSSPRAVLKVEKRSVETLCLVEVFSEQGLLLLTLPLVEHPPHSCPELKQDIALSSNRTLSLLVRFACDGASIEVVYEDPHFTDDFLQELHASAVTYRNSETTTKSSMETDKAGSIIHGPIGLSRWRFLLQRVHVSVPRFTPLISILTTILIAISMLTWTRTNQGREHIHFHDSIENSVRAENNMRTEHSEGAIHQRLELQVSGKTLRRDIYRDVKGRRKVKKYEIDKDEQLLIAKLAEAGLDWNNPLSAVGFKNWHDHLIHADDQIEKMSSKFLVLTTNADSGIVRSESLTLRSDDFHPVAMTVLLQNRESIEIAELSYNVVPWGPLSDSWFEPLERPTTSTPKNVVREPFPPPSSVTESQLDLASLSALLALQELHAETERLELTRLPEGIEVKGIVESESRKRQIDMRLRMIPHLLVDISSYKELDQKNRLSSGIDAVTTMSVVSEESQLDKHCTMVRIPRDDCRELSYRILNSSTEIVRNSKRVSELQRQFPAGKALSAKAKNLLIELVRGHLGHFGAALSDQQEAINMLGIKLTSKKDIRGCDTGLTNESVLKRTAMRNLDITHQLVYASDEDTKPASTLIQDLAKSLEEMQAAVSCMPVPFAENTVNSSEIPTPH
jgi:DNA-directed RNA polymerase specialized sigma24 family protein